MGELATRMASGFKVEWKTLGLGLGKLCRRKDELPDVTADDRKAAQMLADRQTRIVLENDGSVSTGTDLGWHVMDTALIGEPNVLLAEIRDSLRSGKISYAKIAKTGETLVFRTSSSRKRLKEWAKGQGRKQVVEDVLGTQVIAARTRLPPVHVVEVNPFTVLPRLTRDLRLEKKDRSRDDSLYFTSGTHQEELSKRQEIREQRKQVQTKLQYDAHLKSENFAAIDDQLLMEAIDRMSLDVADTDKMQMLTEQQARHAEGVLDEYFEELVKRRLGITFDGLAGTDDVERMNRESLCFRFRLGDEELLAADKWAAAAMDGWDEVQKRYPSVGPIPTHLQRPRGIEFVVADGESGPGAGPAHPDWFRSIRDQCKAAGVPFMFKQWGEWRPRPDLKKKPCGSLLKDWRIWTDDVVMERVGKKAAGRLLDGVEHMKTPWGTKEDRHGRDSG